MPSALVGGTSDLHKVRGDPATLRPPRFGPSSRSPGRHTGPVRFGASVGTTAPVAMAEQRPAPEPAATGGAGRYRQTALIRRRPSSPSSDPCLTDRGMRQ